MTGLNQEGNIKFDCEWDRTGGVDLGLIESLNKWRDKLYEMGLIGVYADGIGYGNISQRLDEKRFIVTGTATGNIKHLNAEHYTIVEEYDFQKNSLRCRGLLKASSESLSHAAVYHARPDVFAVFHVHCIPLWNGLIKTSAATPEGIEYGTPEMAYAIIELLENNRNLNIFAMTGHLGGIISIGQNPDQAGAHIVELQC